MLKALDHLCSNFILSDNNLQFHNYEHWAAITEKTMAFGEGSQHNARTNPFSHGVLTGSNKCYIPPSLKIKFNKGNVAIKEGRLSRKGGYQGRAAIKEGRLSRKGGYQGRAAKEVECYNHLLFAGRNRSSPLRFIYDLRLDCCSFLN